MRLPSFSFSSLVEKKPTSVLGVDIGSSSIKVVQLRREKGRAILETYGAIALGPYAGVEIGRATQLPADKIAEALKDLIREANVTTADAGLAIPYSASLVSILKLPAAVEGKLAQTVPLEARKYIPVPIQEVELDWTLVSGGKGSAPTDKLEVMLVAIHNETISKYRQIASDAALVPAFLEIEIFSAVRSTIDRGVAPVAVVDIGASTTKFYVVERGLIRESHLINHGSQELSLNAARALNIPVAQAEERKRKEGLSALSESQPAAMGTVSIVQSFELTLAPLLAEIGHTISFFEQRMNESVSAVVMTGGGSTLKGFEAYAKNKLQTEVQLADPFAKTEAPAFLAPILKEVGPEFSVAVGLALRRLQELG